MAKSKEYAVSKLERKIEDAYNKVTDATVELILDDMEKGRARSVELYWEVRGKIYEWIEEADISEADKDKLKIVYLGGR